MAYYNPGLVGVNPTQMYPRDIMQQQPIQYGQYQMPQPQQSQNSLIPVPNEEIARSYPVAYGNSLTFRDENLPFLYVKTMGSSQLDPPKFEKYRLVKEEDQNAEPEKSSEDFKATTDDIYDTIDRINERIDAIADKFEEIKMAFAPAEEEEPKAKPRPAKRAVKKNG